MKTSLMLQLAHDSVAVRDHWCSVVPFLDANGDPVHFRDVGDARRATASFAIEWVAEAVGPDAPATAAAATQAKAALNRAAIGMGAKQQGQRSPADVLNDQESHEEVLRMFRLATETERDWESVQQRTSEQAS